MIQNKNFISAKDKKEFFYSLCREVQKFRNPVNLNFDQCIESLFYLGSLNLDYFLTGYGEQKLEKTFSGKLFAVEETQVFGHNITVVMKPLYYEIIVCHAIEAILRRLISVPKDFNDLLAFLIQDSGRSIMLRGYIKRVFSAYWNNRKWLPTPKEMEEEVEFFPFLLDPNNKFKLVIYSDSIAKEYQDKYNEIYNLMNIILDTKVPLGKYEYAEEYNEDLLNEYEVKGTITFDKSSFKSAFNNIFFMIYNANLGISIKLGNISNLEFLLSSNFSVEQLIIFLLSVRVDLELGSIDIIDCIKSTINKLLLLNGTNLDRLINKKIFYKKKVFCETIIDFLSELKNETLFKLALNPEEYFDCVDYKGIVVKDYLKNYIIKVQLKRFKNNIELDRNIRSVLNTSSFKKKQILLMSVFSDMDFDIILKEKQE